MVWQRIVPAVRRLAPGFRPRRWATLLRRRGAHRSRLAILATGFLTIMAVITAATGISLYSMGQTRDSLQQLANHLQRKMVEVATMREHLYLRIVSSRDMLLMTDMFDIDAEAQRFHTYPALIETAYLRFRELADDPQEIALAEKFMEEAKLGLPLLNAVVDQLLAGRQSAEIVPLLTQAFETQKFGLATLLTLHDHLQQRSVRLAGDAVARHESTQLLVMSLTALALLFVLGIAMAVAVLIEQHGAELDREHRKFKSLFDTSGDAVLLLTDGAISECNRRALEWFDERGVGALAGRRLDDLSPAAHNTGEAAARMRATMKSEQGGTFEWVFRNRHGEPFHGEVTLTTLPDSDPLQHQVVIRDVTERVLAMRTVRYEALHDPLTGLANRRAFERRARLAVERAVHEDACHVLCYLDLDNFKPVNDTAGHAAGDALLQQVAELIKSRTRTGDLLARIGGDEFGLLLEDCTLDKGVDIAGSVIQAVDALRFAAADRTFRIGVSIGIATITGDASSFDELMATADRACYAAKRDIAHWVVADAVSPS